MDSSDLGENSWFFLSHIWGEATPAYANGPKIKITECKSMHSGDSCNTIKFNASNHIGTHIDFPRHFDITGKTVTDYSAKEFVFNNTGHLWFEKCEKGTLIRVADVIDAIEKKEIDKKIDFLLIRTGASLWRKEDCYWNNGIGIGAGVADFLRKTFPNLKGIGLDTISISSYAHREVGRIVHKEFLANPARPLLIIEDMNLELISDKEGFQMIALPLLIDGADGAPCTIVGRKNTNKF
jgi:arylformamidase